MCNIIWFQNEVLENSLWTMWENNIKGFKSKLAPTFWKSFLMCGRREVDSVMTMSTDKHVNVPKVAWYLTQTPWMELYIRPLFLWKLLYQLQMPYFLQTKTFCHHLPCKYLLLSQKLRREILNKKGSLAVIIFREPSHDIRK